jgi:hypothetical protein
MTYVLGLISRRVDLIMWIEFYSGLSLAKFGIYALSFSRLICVCHSSLTWVIFECKLTKVFCFSYDKGLPRKTLFFQSSQFFVLFLLTVSVHINIAFVNYMLLNMAQQSFHFQMLHLSPSPDCSTLTHFYWSADLFVWEFKLNDVMLII